MFSWVMLPGWREMREGMGRGDWRGGKGRAKNERIGKERSLSERGWIARQQRMGMVFEVLE